MIFKLLVVDDEVTMRKGISNYMNWASIDCQVVGSASDGVEAMEFLKSQPVDIVITDIKMPAADGLEVARFVHEKWAMGLEGAVILSNPVPDEFAMDEATIDGAIAKAVELSVEEHIAGEKSTPFLLSKVCELTGGASLRANIEIVRNNARVAAQIAKLYSELER